MPFNATAEQEKAIGARGDLLVSAAAGSGKTAVLVERVVRMLSDEANPVDANRLLVVTFTKAAADEMRQRIENRLNGEIRRTGSRFLARQRTLLYGAKICTIDAFCIDFLRSHFDAAGMEPDFKVADEIQTAGAKNAAFRQTLDEAAASSAPDFEMFAQCFMRSKEGELQKHIYKIWDYAVSMPFPELWLKKVANMYGGDFAAWESEIFGEAGETVDECVRTAENCLRKIPENSGFDKYSEIFKCDILPRLYEMRRCVADKDWGGLAERVFGWKTRSLPVGKIPGFENLKEEIKGDKASVRDGVDALKKLLPRASYADIREYTVKVGGAVRAAAEFVIALNARFEESMRGASTYTFDMLERAALRLLCEPDANGNILPTPLAGELRGDFSRIFVDEYQDTNDLQDTLFKALAGSHAELFTVGDVKQSIYSFRHTNPENFLKRRDGMPWYEEGGSGGKIVLSKNFRSRREICDFVNFTFRLLMRRKTAGIDYDENEELVCSANFDTDRDGGVEYHIIEADGSGDKRENLEARSIASYIKKTVSGGREIKLNGAVRPPRYGDFAVLMQSPGPRAAVYAEEFRRCGVPVTLEVKAFWQTPEILLAVSLLRAIDRPSNDIALLSVMLSGIIGFTADRVAVIKTVYGAKDGSLISAVSAGAEAGEEDCLRFVRKLSEWRMAAVTARPGELVARLYDDTGLPVIMGARDNGERRRENLFKFQSYADAYASSSRIGTLSSFLRNIADEPEIKLASPSGANAVRIMSVHASKGLQFPFCILAGNFTGFNTEDLNGSVTVSDQLGIGARYYDKKSGLSYETLSNMAVKIHERRRMKAEKIRLLYVAMTRAEYKLDIYICESRMYKDDGEKGGSEPVLRKLCSSIRPGGTVSDAAVLQKNRFSEWLLLSALAHPDTAPALERHENTADSACVRVSFVSPSETADITEKVTPAAVSPELFEKMKANFGYVYPYSAVNAVRSKVSVTDLTEKKENPEGAFTARPAFARKSGMNAAEKGTVLHKFMQLCDFGNAARSVPDEINRLTEFEYLSEAEASALNVSALSGFFLSDICRRVSSGRMYREFPFIVPRNTESGDDYTVLQGVVDCASLFSDGIILLDYKTDRVGGPEELIRRYGQQISLYRRALEEVFELPVKESGIYSFSLGEYIRL